MMIDESLAEVVRVGRRQAALLEYCFGLHLQQQIHEQVGCQLYQDHILIFLERNQPEALRVELNYDTSFQLLRQQKQPDKLGLPFGLRIERHGQSLTLLGKTGDQQLLLWRNLLANRISLRGFRELFKALKMLGKGNFGTVYLVRKHEDGREYAVKGFSKEVLLRQEHGQESLRNEINIMRRFRHKNLMQLHQVYETQNSFYLSIELLQGGQLYDKVKSRHRFTPRQIKTVMKGILEGLEVLHAAGVMHRDLKPQNILLRRDDDYDCVIADFGLAQLCSQKYLFVRCGTPGFVAPQIVELRQEDAKYGPACDLFSAGVILHLLALQQPPFPGRQYDEVLSQNRACNLDFELPQYQQLPADALNLLRRMLEKDPAKRITASEALNHEFFSQDEHFKDFVEVRKAPLLVEECSSPLRTSRRAAQVPQECNSPLMMTRNRERKNRMVLRDDSCLKFKMHENLLTGRTDQPGGHVDEINSPVAVRTRGVRAHKSRFERVQP